jgi:putative ABC transport system ATP-binding protein
MPDTPLQQPVVQVADARKTYRIGRREVEALRGVTLEVPRGAFVVLQGPSGSGKTTLLNLIGCIDHPSSGKVIVSGADVAALTDRALSRFRAQKLGFIFQNFNLIPVLGRVPRDEARRRAQGMLEAVGLADVAVHRPAELSGGQCQRVAIARALVTSPELVIADEPTANLDSATGQAIINLMHEMRDRTGTSFLISTHDPAIAALAELRFQLRDGLLHEKEGA